MNVTDKSDIKKATSLDEQLTLFKKRGLDTFYKDDDARKYLFDIGYYRLGFYLFPFEKSYPQFQYKKFLKSQNFTLSRLNISATKFTFSSDIK